MRVATGLAVFILVAGMALSATAQQRRIEEGGRVSADANFEIYNIAGTVTVTAWDRNEVQVRGTLGEGVRRLNFESSGDEVEIKVEMPRRWRRGEGADEIGDTHLEIMVPAGASLEIETLAAAVVVEGVHGDVSVESSAGDIVYAGASLDIQAETAAGVVEVRSSSAGATIDVGGVAGNVVVEFTDAEVSVTTLTGNVRAIGGRLRDGDFESVSGDLYFEGEIAAGVDISFENFDGGIDLIIAEDTSANFAVTSYSGSIETDFGYEGLATGDFSTEVEAEFRLGNGSADVSIETFAGNVTVRALR